VLASFNNGCPTQQDNSGRTVRLVGSHEQIVVTLSCRDGVILATTRSVPRTQSHAPGPVSSPERSPEPSDHPEPMEQPSGG
jgi:hypothetical protein